MNEINSNILNPFLTAASNVIMSALGEQPVKGKVALTDVHTDFDKDIAVILGVAGGVFGWVSLMLKEDVACGIASNMLGREVHELDESVRSAIGEMGNTIIGNATIGLESNGYLCSITPPAVVSGKDLRIARLRGIKMLTVSFTTSRGRVGIILGLKESALDGG
jgi:chemotaxis protein CheX